MVNIGIPTPLYDSDLDGIFSDTGTWCADFLEAAGNIYTKVCAYTISLLTEDVSGDGFSGVLSLVTSIADVIARISAPLVVLFFLYRLFEELSSTSNPDIWVTARSFLKVGVASVLVSNAVTIVRYIFKIGSLLAMLVMVMCGYGNRPSVNEIGQAIADYYSGKTDVTPSEAFATSSGINIYSIMSFELPDEYRTVLAKTISGLLGYLILVIFLIGGVALIVCGITVLISAYQRIFKMLVLLPFGAFSFSTYILPDNKGHEIFQGYLKGIIRIALEAIVIAILITSSLVLMSNMDETELFPMTLEEVDLENQPLLGTAEITNKDEMIYVGYSYIYGKKEATRYEGTKYDLDNCSEATTLLVAYLVGSTIAPGETYVGDTLLTTDVMQSYIKEAENGTLEYPITVYYRVYGTSDWLDALSILLRTIFPALLMAAVVKETDKITGIIAGGQS